MVDNAELPYTVSDVQILLGAISFQARYPHSQPCSTYMTASITLGESPEADDDIMIKTGQVL